MTDTRVKTPPASAGPSLDPGVRTEYLLLSAEAIRIDKPVDDPRGNVFGARQRAE